jgi:hypothetical protein
VLLYCYRIIKGGNSDNSLSIEELGCVVYDCSYFTEGYELVEIKQEMPLIYINFI